MGDAYNAQGYAHSRVPPRQSSDDGEGSFVMDTLGAALPSYASPSSGYRPSANVQRFPSFTNSPLQQQQQQQQQQGLHLGGHALQPGAGQHFEFSSHYPTPYGSAQGGSPHPQQFQQLQAHRRPLNPSPQSNIFPAQQLFYPTPYGQMSPTQQSFPG